MEFFTNFINLLNNTSGTLSRGLELWNVERICIFTINEGIEKRIIYNI